MTTVLRTAGLWFFVFKTLFQSLQNYESRSRHLALVLDFIMVKAHVDLVTRVMFSFSVQLQASINPLSKDH